MSYEPFQIDCKFYAEQTGHKEDCAWVQWVAYGKDRPNPGCTCGKEDAKAGSQTAAVSPPKPVDPRLSIFELTFTDHCFSDMKAVVIERSASLAVQLFMDAAGRGRRLDDYPILAWRIGAADEGETCRLVADDDL